MGKVPQEIIDQILDRVDIVDVVGGYIPIKKTGRNFKACCPFHNEKTPSFVVSPDKQIYHCFGCGEGGNSLGFVMKMENMSFPEAIELLAEKAHVELPKHSKQDEAEVSLSSRLYEINNLAAAFFQNQLMTARGKTAIDYLSKRGITRGTLAGFRLGYALDEWDALKKTLLSKGFAPDLLQKSGLFVANEKTKNEYDRFRNRVMFPIFNERNNVIAFGARVLDNSLPKYINSPETPVYVKSNTLYGLNFSKSGIREKGYVIIVEGYMDVVIPFQSGVNNLVATSGTALTDRHVAALKRYTDTAVIVFDPDQAGKAASLRGLEVLVENNMNVRIATVPGGDDPDSYVTEHGAKGFYGVVDSAKDLFDYKLDLLLESTPGKEVRDKVSVVRGMLPTIAKITDAVTQDAYLKRLSQRMNIDERAIREEMRKIKPDFIYVDNVEKVQPARGASAGASVNSEMYLLGLALSEKRYFMKIMDEISLETFRDDNVKKVLELICDIYSSEDRINPGKLLSRFEGDPAARSAVVQSISRADISDDKDKVLADCLVCVKKENKTGILKALTGQLKLAESDNNQSKVAELLAKISKLQKEKVA